MKRIHCASPKTNCANWRNGCNANWKKDARPPQVLQPMGRMPLWQWRRAVATPTHFRTCWTRQRTDAVRARRTARTKMANLRLASSNPEIRTVSRVQNLRTGRDNNRDSPAAETIHKIIQASSRDRKVNSHPTNRVKDSRAKKANRGSSQGRKASRDNRDNRDKRVNRASKGNKAKGKDREADKVNRKAKASLPGNKMGNVRWRRTSRNSKSKTPARIRKVVRLSKGVRISLIACSRASIPPARARA